MEKITFKRGDTFTLSCSTDQPIDGFIIKSQIRSKQSVLIASLIPEITQTSPTGSFKLKGSNTQTWAIGTHECDIQYKTAAGTVVSTDTFEIEVAKDITYIS